MAEHAGRVVVASFNMHAGIDGWGRPYDPVPTCLAADADVLLLVEHFTPERADELAGATPEPSAAERLVAAGAYEVAAEATLCRAALVNPPVLGPRARSRWGRGGATDYGLRLLVRPPGAARRQRARPARVRGGWGMVLLSRLPVRTAKVLPLTPLRRDPIVRALLHVEVECPDGTPLVVTGAHLPHLSHGSPLRFGELRRALPPASAPGVFMGDMNCFGPPLSLALPHWRRAVRGRTWPAWKPIAQPDHIFVSRAVRATTGRVLRQSGSDHNAVVATLSW